MNPWPAPGVGRLVRAKDVTPIATASKLRRATWRARKQLQGRDATGRPSHPVPQRTLRCGASRFVSQPEVHELDGRAWWHGTVRCRARVCPVCWVARRATLAHEIAHVCESWRREHQAVPQLATLTIRHHAAAPVSIVRDVRACWRAHLQGRGWQQYRRGRGIELIAAEEVTLGEHGWHPHMHILLLPSREQSTELHRVDAMWWHDKWARIVARKMGAAFVPSREHGTDLRPCRVDQYLSKLGIELTDSGAVKARSPFALLRDGSIDKYLELQLSRKRARDVTWSRGLRALRDTLPARPEPRVLWQPHAYEFERAADAGTLLATIEAAETGGADAARRALWSSNTEPESVT